MITLIGVFIGVIVIVGITLIRLSFDSYEKIGDDLNRLEKVVKLQDHEIKNYKFQNDEQKRELISYLLEVNDYAGIK